MATPMLESLQRERRTLAKLKKELRTTQESVRLLVKDDEDTCVVREGLEFKEIDLVAQIELLNAHVVRMEQELEMKLHDPYASTPVSRTSCAFGSVVDVNTPMHAPIMHAPIVHAPEVHAPELKPIPIPIPLTPMEKPMTTPSPCGLTVAGLSRLELPTLVESIGLRQHYLRVERILIESQGASVIEGKVQLLPQLRHSIIAKFIKSIQIPTIKKTAEHLADYESDWEIIKSRLTDRYCDAHTLYQEYRSLINGLTWNGVREIGSFIEKVRDVWRIGRIINTNPGLEQKTLYDRTRELIGASLFEQVLKRLAVVNTIEWEFRVQLEEFLAALHTEAKYIVMASNVSVAKQVSSHDKVHVVSVETSSHRGGESSMFRATEYKNTLVVSHLKPADEVPQLRQCLSTHPARDMKEYTRRGGSRGIFLGFHDQASYQKAKEILSTTKDVSVRDFDPNYKKKAPLVRDGVRRAMKIGGKPPVEYFVNGTVCVKSSLRIQEATVLVDTGAGYSYITTMDSPTRRSLEQHDVIESIDDPFMVSMADGSNVQVTERITANVAVHVLDNPTLTATSAELELFIMPTPNSTSTEILLGRTAIDALDLVVGRTGVTTSTGIKLMDTGNRDKILPRDSVNLTRHQPLPMAHLDECVSRGWTPLLRSPAYQARLRPITCEDVQDHPEQTHIYEIRVPDTAPANQTDEAVIAAAGKARRCHQRLTSSLKLKQDDIVNKYVDKQWWRKSSIQECRRLSRFQPVAAFLVGLDGSKPRIVVDFPEVNDTLPASSTPSTMPAQLLACLRMQRPSCVVISDISSAFYKVRLEKDLLWITIASTVNGRIEIQHFLSPRVVFGILFGPSALITTLTELFSVNQKLAPCIKSFCGWYVDDNICAGTPSEVTETIRWAIVALRRVGHDLQFTKCAAVCHPSVRTELSQLLGEVGAINVVETATIFQTAISYSKEGFLVAHCENTNRRLALEALASDNPKSKSDFASLCGTLSYDIVHNHPRERAIADAFRSLIGKEFHYIQDWDQKLPLGNLSREKSECLQLLKNWCVELAHDAQGMKSNCQHFSPVSSQPCRQPILHLYVDASVVGGGHVLCCDLMQYPIWTDNYRWKGSECRWHINVMELQAVNRALRSLADLLECFCRCTRNVRPLVHVYCDNKSAVKWSSLNSREYLNKHQSRRTIVKLVDEIAEEWKIIRALADTSLQHLSGETNGLADELSRIYHRKLIPTSEMNLNELLEYRPIQTNDEPKHILELVDDHTGLADEDHIVNNIYCMTIKDTVRAITSARRESVPFNLIDSLAGQCCDMMMLHDCFKSMVNILRSWRAVTTRQNFARFNPTPIELDTQIGKAAQANLDRNTLPLSLRADTGPLYFDPQQGLLLYRNPLPSGKYESLPFIPKQCSILQTLMIRDAHRKAAHMGVDYTISKLTGFVIQRLRPRTQEVLRLCLFCQRKHADRGMRSAFDMVHNRLQYACYQSIAIDILALGDQIDVLVVHCLMSGHTTLSICTSKTANDVAIALKRVIYRYGVFPRQVLADAAVNLSAGIEQIRREFGELEFTQTTAHSQFENGKLERLNAIALHITQYKSHFDKLDLSKLQNELDRQDLCDYLSFHLNQRPLGPYYVSGEPALDTRILITPHSILYGNNLLGINQSTYIQQNEWKTYFYDHCWRTLKRRSDANIRARGSKFHIGEPVLFYSPSKKSVVPWRLGHIVDVMGKRVKLRSAEHRSYEFELNEYNVQPLRYLPCDETDSVTRIGAHITYTLDNIDYPGIVTDESPEGLLTISWDPANNVTWLPELLEATAVRIL